jgi:hypothetical protein
MAGELNTLSTVTKGTRPGDGLTKAFSYGIPVAAVALILYFFGSSIGDYMVNAVDNIFHLFVVGIGIALLGWLVVDGQLRNMVFYLYRSMMRWLTSQFISIDPIGILKTYKERMEGKLNEMKESLDALKGQRVKVQRRQQANDAELENTYGLLNQAVKNNDQSGMNINKKQVTRLEAKKARYIEEMKRLTLLITIMDRYYHLCSDTIIDMGNEIKFREEEREEAKADRGVVRGAMAILKGLPEKDMWDEATVKLEQDYTAAMGEVENFLDVTKDILKQSDLQDGVDTEKAMQMLDAWQNKNAGVQLGGNGNQVSKANIISDATRQIEATPAALTMSMTSGKPMYVPAQQQTSGDEYGDLFKKK